MQTFKISNLLLLILTCTIGFAQVPRQIMETVGGRASSLDGVMSRNGYNHIKSEASGYDAYDYYWNYNSKKCIVSHVSDGRVASIVDTMPFDCNKGGTNGNTGYHHSSHHHTNKTHYPSETVDQAFERGHNDGLYNLSYHNIYSGNEHQKAYAEGYSSGVDQRNRNSYHHSGRAGYHPHVQVNDLIGKKAIMAYGELTKRGFVQEKESKSPGTTYRDWYNNKTQQCIRTTSQHEDITRVQVSTNCGRG